MTLFGREFNILGIVVAAIHNDQIFMPAGNIELALMQETKIAGAEKRT